MMAMMDGRRGMEGYQEEPPEDYFDIAADSIAEPSSSSPSVTAFGGGSSGRGAGGEDALLSYGEQLVLETYMRCRQRPYNRQHQERLAQPKKLRPPEAGFQGIGCSSADKTKIASIVSRLASPRKQQADTETAPEPGANMVVQQEEAKKRRDIDLVASISRLSAPKPRTQVVGVAALLSNPTSAASRPVNLGRLHALAQPSKRAATCRSWGVHPDFTRDVSSIATTPRSSRSTEGRGLRALGGQIAGTPMSARNSAGASSGAGVGASGGATSSRGGASADSSSRPQSSQVDVRHQRTAQTAPMRPADTSELPRSGAAHDRASGVLGADGSQDGSSGAHRPLNDQSGYAKPRSGPRNANGRAGDMDSSPSPDQDLRSDEPLSEELRSSSIGSPGPDVRHNRNPDSVPRDGPAQAPVQYSKGNITRDRDDGVSDHAYNSSSASTARVEGGAGNSRKLQDRQLPSSILKDDDDDEDDDEDDDLFFPGLGIRAGGGSSGVTSGGQAPHSGQHLSGSQPAGYSNTGSGSGSGKHSMTGNAGDRSGSNAVSDSAVSGSGSSSHEPRNRGAHAPAVQAPVIPSSILQDDDEDEDEDDEDLFFPGIGIGSHAGSRDGATAKGPSHDRLTASDDKRKGLGASNGSEGGGSYAGLSDRSPHGGVSSGFGSRRDADGRSGSGAADFGDGASRARDRNRGSEGLPAHERSRDGLDAGGSLGGGRRGFAAKDSASHSFGGSGSIGGSRADSLTNRGHGSGSARAGAAAAPMGSLACEDDGASDTLALDGEMSSLAVDDEFMALLGRGHG